MQWKKFPLLFFGLTQSLLTFGFMNPIKQTDGSDPFMVYDQGYYYLTTTTWTNIQITRATTITGLKMATPKVVWSDLTASRCCNVRAPEIHYMPKEASWYIYYTAAPNITTTDNLKSHVLKGSSKSIWDSTWSYAGRLVIPNRDNEWAVDGTVLIVGSNRYFVYSTYAADQTLWIAPMTSATTLGNTSEISTPTYPWERELFPVNEGPAALYSGSRTFIVYSASHCYGTGYKLGQIALTGSDPLKINSWTKKSTPIFQTGNGIYQPGNSGFFKSPSGNQTWIVYHADKHSGSTCDGTRFTAVQPIGFASNGEPDLGSPSPLTENIAEPV